MFKIKNISGDAVRDLRIAVFSLEQGYPAEKIFDEKENTADFLAILNDGRAVGCGRLFRESANVFHIDNIALSSEVRGGGHGRELVRALISECRKSGAEKVTVNAKIKAVGFYEKCGFVPCDGEFADENFIRIPMVYTVSDL